MKHLKKFNELKSSTYYSAASKLKAIGHERRSGEVYNWGKEVDKREEEKGRKSLEEKWSKNGSFEMSIFEVKTKRNATGTYEHIHTMLMTGNFYIILDLDASMFLDLYKDWSRDHNSQLFLTLNMGIIPADEETRLEFNKHSFESYRGIYWVNFLCIKLCNAGDRMLNPSGDITFDSFGSDVSLFSNRKDAVRFKNLISNSLDKGTNSMDSVIATFDEILDDIGPSTGDVPNDIMDKIVKTTRLSSTNLIYREE